MHFTAKQRQPGNPRQLGGTIFRRSGRLFQPDAIAREKAAFKDAGGSGLREVAPHRATCGIATNVATYRSIGPRAE